MNVTASVVRRDWLQGEGAVDVAEYPEQQFDEIYLDFWQADADDPRAKSAANSIMTLASLASDAWALDMGSGYGRIAIPLAKLGVSVLAVDRSLPSLERFPEAPRNCLPICCDWRHPAWAPASFDCVYFWFTTLCAGIDADLEALRVAHNSLKPGGFVLIETRHWDRQPRLFAPLSIRTRSGGRLVESHVFHCASGFQLTEERFEVGNDVTIRHYRTKRYSTMELQAMCLRAGFHSVGVFDGAGRPIEARSERMILRAAKGVA